MSDFARRVVQWLYSLGIGVAAFAVDYIQRAIEGVDPGTSWEGILLGAVIGLAARGLGWLGERLGPPRDEPPAFPSP